MKLLVASSLIFCAASVANADCAADEGLYLSCELRDGNKRVSVCFDDDQAHYKYGKINAPAELEISTPFSALDYMPSSRNGQSVIDQVVFENGQYHYEVIMGFLIPFEDIPKGELAPFVRFGDTRFGEITVSRKGEIISEQQCRFESIVFNQKSMIEATNTKGVKLWTPWVARKSND